MPYDDEEEEYWGGGESVTDDSADDEDDDTLPCPYCHREVHVDSQRCPYCEQYLSIEDAPSRPKPWWVTIGVLLCLFATLFWLALEVLGIVALLPHSH